MKINVQTRLGDGADLLVDAHGTAELAMTLGPEIAFGVERVQALGLPDCWHLVVVTVNPADGFAPDGPPQGLELHLGREEFKALLGELAAAEAAA